MTRVVAVLLTLALIMPFPNLAWAHRVQVFAGVENGLIEGEATLSGGKKVKNGQIKVLTNDERKLLLTVSTGEAGSFTIDPLELGLERPVDLLIVLEAGPGHRSEWQISGTSYTISADKTDNRSASPADSPDTRASLPATPPLKNVVSGILSILGLGALIAWARSRKRGKK